VVWEGAWPTHVLAESRRRLGELSQELHSLTHHSSEVEQALSRFLVIRSCGHIEFTFEESFCSFAEARSSPSIAAYIRSGFFKGANPRPERLVTTLKRLDPVIAADVEIFLQADDQERSRDLQFLIDRRNKIAHGQSENVGRRRALELASVAIDLGDLFVQQLDPR